MNKKELRELGKEILLNIAAEEKQIITEKMVNELFLSTLWKEAKTIGVTVSTGFEWDTTPIIERAWEEGKSVVVPKCIPEIKRLDFYRLNSFNQLEDSFYNLREPNPALTTKVEKQEIELLIVPGLIFDKQGYRVGFGGGYYDRFLTDFPNKTVSVFYSEQLIDEVPKASYDIAVQHLLTEKGFV
ncbi:5-formyltetrahydrofolate cyclo-ligase [Oceanobacillus sp. CAU 1775]